MGYTETSCSGGSGIKCPFGNKWACFKTESEICNDLGFTLSCSGTNQTGGSGKACNGKYNYCSCADGYVWQNGACTEISQTVPCTVGALYYADDTCSNDYLSNKELLGIVIHEKSAGENGWVMTHKPIATNIEWGPATVTGITNKDSQSSCTNTQKLVALGSNYKAAISANNHKAGGKTWCLPTYDVLNNLNNQTNLIKYHAAILTIQSQAGVDSASILGFDIKQTEYIWSSSETNGSSAWSFNITPSKGGFSMGEYTTKNMGNIRSVRPVMSF